MGNQDEMLDCCVCLSPMHSAAFFNESEFRRIFSFYCSHSSNVVCRRCWARMYYQHGNETRCLICRRNATIERAESKKANETVDSAPYGLANESAHGHVDSPARIGIRTSQPGYRYRVGDSEQPQCCGFDNSCVVWTLRSTIRMVRCVIGWGMSNDDFDAFCCCCCPCFVVGTICMSATICATMVTTLTLTCCCCCDCCQLCFPQSKCQHQCLYRCDLCLYRHCC